MWVGLIVGLTTAAVLLSTRFLRSSRRVPMNAGTASESSP
jgi:MATE family multidrug resistance protein